MVAAAATMRPSITDNARAPAGRFAQSARREGRAAPSLDKANLLSVSSEALWEQLQSLTDQLNDQVGLSSCCRSKT